MDIREPHRKHLFLYCCIYSALHSNGSYPIVACVFVAAGVYLPSRCTEMGHNMKQTNVYMHNFYSLETFLETEYWKSL
jgi:hypothetical protein